MSQPLTRRMNTGSPCTDAQSDDRTERIADSSSVETAHLLTTRHQEAAKSPLDKLKRDAEAHEAQVSLAKRRGDLVALDAGKQTLRSFVAEWWTLFAEQRLAVSTQRSYAVLRDPYIVPQLGHLQLRAVTPQRVQRFQAEMTASGVGAPTVRRTLAILQSMLERAVEWERVTRNPVRNVRKPPQVGRTRIIRTLGPPRSNGFATRCFDATGGGTPCSPRFSRTRDSVLRRRSRCAGATCAIERSSSTKALAFGVEKTTKTRATRTVRLLSPLASDLAEWRQTRRPSPTALVFSTSAGRPWSDVDYRNWRRRRFTVAADKVGLSGARPYDLRHSFASLLLAEQMNPAEIAAQLGHSLQTLFGTYAHVIEELRGQGTVDAEDEIKAARQPFGAGDVAQKLPASASAASVAPA